jgi:hypothetical protein
MHDVIIKEIREENLFAKPKQTILKIEARLLWKILVGVNYLLPVLFRKTSIVTRNS